MTLPARLPDPRLNQIVKLAVMAVGGQGGGVLTAWIEAVARAQGFVCQATSVAGVSQRTGATIYYIEMAPAGPADPVFSLAPAAGDVDILIAAEMMEAGRAILRGFVTPDRTTLIASTHRALAVSEKSTPGDGIADAQEVRAAAEIAARALILFDMEALAVQNGTVISAALLGALAGSGTLPFPRQAFEAAVRGSGKGVEPSLRAFDAAFRRAQAGNDAAAQPRPTPEPALTVPPAMQAEWSALTRRITRLPASAQALATAGLRKVVDFQDLSYGADYLTQLEAIAAQDTGQDLTTQTAKYLANAMAYDDVIRVADRKTRAARFARIRTEMQTRPGTLLRLTEYMHPRAEEITGLLPVRLGARLQASPKAMARIDRLFGKGRHYRSDRLAAFVALYALSGLRWYRRHTLRHAQESRHWQEWLALALATARHDYALGVEIIRCRRLIKGYSDTHSRGLSKFDKVIDAARQLQGRPDAADWTRRLRDAALKDEGKALDGALATVASFLSPAG